MVDAVLGFSQCSWKILSTVEGIQSYLQAFSCFSVVCISCGTNEAAHVATKCVLMW